MDILKREHRRLWPKGVFKVKQKQHGHQDHRHMMMPAPPADDLVFIQSGQAFAVLQGALDPIASRLPFRQAGRLGWLGIGKAVFGLRAVQFLAYAWCLIGGTFTQIRTAISIGRWKIRCRSR